jgi:hypothetical protein
LKGLGLDPSVSTFNRIRIFAIGTPEECRALSWGFRQLGPSSNAPEITETSLSQLSQARQEADFFVVFVDLGQPVPVSALSEAAQEIPGVVVFTQPTPTQLLSVFKLPNWSAQIWDGSNSENLARDLSHYLLNAEKSLRQKIFFRDALRILAGSQKQPNYLEWINPPKTKTGPTRFSLDPLKGYFSIGSLESKCDIELPLNSKGNVLEFRWIEGQWVAKILNNQISVLGLDSNGSLRIGSTLKVGDLLLIAKAQEAIASLNSLAAQQSPTVTKVEETQRDPTLTSFLQDLLLRNFTGEIQLSSGLRRATLWIHTGAVDQVFAGPVSGEKALERIVTWPNPVWRYREGPYQRPENSSLKLLPTTFSIFCDRVIRQWERLVALAPPINIQIEVDPKRFQSLETLTPQQTKVLAAVSEFGLVRDILNYCPLRDLEIYESLIEFRKSGMIRIHK